MIKVKELNNGVRVVMEPISHVRSVSIGIWVKAGAVNESDSISGISHFIEHMMFKGTEKRTAKEIASDADRIAGQSNAFTGKEATCYYIKTLSDNVDEGLDIVTDMFMNSLFDPEELERERRVIFEEMKMIEDSPEDDIHDIITGLVFAGKPLGRSIIGNEKSLLSIDSDTIRAYIDREYNTDTVVVSIAGNFDEDRVLNLLEGKFDRLKKGYERKAPENVIYVPGFKSKVKEIEQSHLCLAVPTIPRDHEDYQELAVLNNIFGGSMSSRLFQNIRESKGLAYSVYSMASSFSTDGYFNVYAGVSHDKIEAATAGLKEEILDVKKNGISADEIDIAKAQLMGSLIYSMENTNSRMFSMGKNMCISNKIVPYEDTINEIKAVNRNDILEVAELILNTDMYSAAVISDHEVPIEEYVRG